VRGRFRRAVHKNVGLTSNVCLFTAILDEDSIWIDQYLGEVERLNLNFAIHFDRCYPETKCRLSNHPLCIGSISQEEDEQEFLETHKQGILDIVNGRKGVRLAVALDIDERFERDAAAKLQELSRTNLVTVSCPVWQLWENESQLRVDPPFTGMYRQRGYNLRAGYRFVFDNYVVNAPSTRRDYRQRVLTKEPLHEKVDLHVLHSGMMTRELRLQHLERWNRIYGKARGRNPYNFWKHICDEENHPAKVIPNPYL
jgi:hypothetical protein